VTLVENTVDHDWF